MQETTNATLIDIKQEIEKTKHCQLFYEIEDIYKKIENNMNVELVQQILKLYDAYERNQYQEGLD